MNLTGYLLFLADDTVSRDTCDFNEGQSTKVPDASSLAPLFADDKYFPAAIISDIVVGKNVTRDLVMLTNDGMRRPNWCDNEGVREISKDIQKRSSMPGDIIVDLHDRKAYAFNGVTLSPVNVDDDVISSQIMRARNQITKDRAMENKLGKMGF